MRCVTTLDIRTDDIAERLKRFSGLIDQTLDAAASRARDVARVVSEATAESARTIAEQYERVREQSEDVARTMQETGTESARAIGEQFERMREQAETERRRSAAAMHDIFEQTTGDDPCAVRGGQCALRRDAARHEADGGRDAARTRNVA